MIKLKFLLQRLLFNVDYQFLRAGNSNKIFIYEGPDDSDYYEWIKCISCSGDSIVRLRAKLKMFGYKKTNFADLEKYRYYIFHSPGEHLQHKLIQQLNLSGKYTIGLQHGNLPIETPRRAQLVFNRSNVDTYLIFQENIISHINCNVKLMEIESDLYMEKNLQKIYVTVYLDAPDHSDFWSSVKNLKEIGHRNSLKIVEVKYHPKTSKLIRLLIDKYLKSLIVTNRHKSNVNIVWKSKVKEKLPSHNLYTISKEKQILKITKTEKLISDYIKSELDVICI